MGGRLERKRTEIGLLGRSALAVVMVNEDRAAADSGAGIDIAPAITDQKAGFEVDAIALGRGE